MEKNNIIKKIKNSPLYDKSYTFTIRDIQTKNMLQLSKLILDEIKKHDDSIFEGRLIQVLIKIFFGGISLNSKIKDIESIDFKEESKNKIVNFLKNITSFQEEGTKGFELGLTRTPAIAAKNFTGKDKELIIDFFKKIIANKDFETIKSILYKIDEQGTFYFTPGILSNFLFAYNPNIFYVWNNPAQKGLEKHFDISLNYNFSFKDYFENINIFQTIKDEFNLADYGQVDSLITGFGLDTKNGNIRVFLAPASNETSQTHMKDSLIPGKQYKELTPFLSDKGKSILSHLDLIPTWGCVSSLKGRWDQMQPDDWVLFYVRGVFIYAGKVLYKERNSELSQRIWGTTEQGNPWELMFFFEKLFDINIQLDPIRKYSDYSNNWILQGFTRLKESALERIIGDYGTFQKFLGLEESIIPKDKGGEIITEKEGFMNYLTKQGYFFDTNIVENFLLSLKVKPFVILTGNSGTGKTKIAQLFAKYLEQAYNKDIKQYIESEVTVGKSAESGGWSFKRDDFFEIFPQVKKYEGSFPIEVNNQKSKGRLVITPRLFFDSKDTEMKKMLDSLAQKESTKKVPLKIEIPRISSTIGNYYSLIPVGANWTENRHIVGFHNVITNKYQKTAALDVLLLANEISDKPHFLILDEMNLSHVERYFADFLSAMESDEKIPLHDCDEIEEIPNQISIPQNLSVIGTVNVDETTYMFSPKVLDRANTIEFNTHPAKEYMSGKTSNQISEGNFQYLENILSDIDVRKWDINKLKDEFSTIKTSKNILLWDVLSDEINKFQECLRKAGFDFGFRIVNEILRFMYVAWKYENKMNPWNNWERYFDAQIKQKMLPKIHGSQRSIGELFKEMINSCITEKSEKEPRNIENIDKIAKYKTSALKIQEMDKILYDQRYVSFTR